MRYDEIDGSIRQAENLFEKEWGIRTIDITTIYGSEKEGWAIKIASKSDGTSTIFFAHAPKRRSNWFWLCPSKEHIAGLRTLIRVYWENEEYNKRNRL